MTIHGTWKRLAEMSTVVAQGWGKAAKRRLLHGAPAMLLVAGLGAQLPAQSASVPFPTTAVGSTSASLPVTLTLGAAGGTVGSVAVVTGGATGLDFVNAGGGSCAAGGVYGPGGMCTVMVSFTPKYPGQRAGAAVLLDGAGKALAITYVGGTGQGALAIFVPGTINTVAGDGQFTALRDGGPATLADLNLPLGVVLDGVGNLYIADSADNRIRKVDAQTQIITTIAGNGGSGDSGDGGPATLAEVGSPNGLTMDGAGNLYFADPSHNVVRRIDYASQVITTVVGNGSTGYAGDGGLATQAALNSPVGVALDVLGNLYVVDQVNAAVRRVDAQTHVITTVAGTGTAGYSGDGAAATTEMLNLPYGAAFDAAGNLYIADSGNNRIREVDAGTHLMTTVAGTGTKGAETGDGGPATAATLNAPRAVAVDPAGNVYLADTQNYRVRKIVNGVINTVAGNGIGVFGGDGNAATLAGLYSPQYLYLDAQGDLYITEYQDNRIRRVEGNMVTLQYPEQLRVGQKSATQNQALENDGNASLDLASLLPDENATVDPTSTTCSPANMLAVAAACTVGAQFTPTVVGDPAPLYPQVGHIVISGNAGDSPLTITLDGTSLPLNSTSITLTSTGSPTTYGTAVTFIANVSTGTGTPTGDVTFKDGAQTIGTGTLNGSLTATFTTTVLGLGAHSITAVYAGDSSHGGSTSAALTQVVQSLTTTTLTASANPTTVNLPLTLTAHVAQSSGAPASTATNPTGSVLFYDGTTPLSPAAVDANGNATLTLSTLTVGTHQLSAHYAGDTSNLASVSASLTETIGQQTTLTVLASSADPSIYGNTVNFTATVSVTGTGTATGAVNLFEGATQIGTAALNGGGMATISLSSLTAGTHALKAVYAGDVNNAGSTSPVFTQTVNQATTATAVSYAPVPAIAGKPITLTATITDATGAGTPGGTVSFTSGGVPLGTATLDGNGVASLSATLGAGVNTVLATYSGDANHSGSTGSLAITAQKATTAIAVSATPNPSVLGSTVSFALAVTGNGGVPTGTVTLSVDGIAAGTATLSNGAATIALANLTVGTHQVTASYAGDTNDNGSVTAQPYTQTVQKANTSLTLTATPNPVIAGNTVTLTALVRNLSGTPTLTGTVQFTDGATVLGTSAVTASGVATLTTNTLPAGLQTITATYSGDGNYVTAVGTVSENVQRVTTATLAASANPALAGTPVTFTIQVTGASTLIPTGTVTLLDGGAAIAVRTLNAAGVATYQTATLSTGTHVLTATYAGDTNNGAATSTALAEVINQAASTTGLTLSGSPYLAGKAVLLTASVSSPGAAPTGRVNFFEGGQLLGTGTIGANGQATLSVTTLAPGAHALVATYLGDTNDLGSSSAPVALSVLQATTTMTLASNGSPALATRPVLLTATVTSDGGKPTGVVTFKTGSITLGTGALSTAGVATISTTDLPIGSDLITASYAGDGNDGGSQATLTEVVQQAAPTIGLATSLTPSKVGQAVTFTATLGNTVGTASGTMTFKDGGTVIGTVTVTGAGASLFTTSALTLGSHSITATYSGDTDDAAATSAAVTQAVQQTTTTTLTASSNPVLGGEAVTFTASVHASNGGALTGSVNFYDGGLLLGTGALAGGTSQLTTSTLTLGTHNITAVYSGDTLDATSTSASLAETVQAATTTVTLTTSGSPSLFGANVTFTAQVTGVGTAPHGTVTFADGGQTLGVTTLGAGGVASFSTTKLGVGTHSITASYSGDTDNTASHSAALSQLVLAQTVTTLTATPGSITATQTVLLTAQVTSAAGTHPTGTLTFKDGIVTLGQEAVNASGVATLQVTTFTAGSHSLTAVYSGDALDTPSTSANVVETVTAIPTQIHLAASATTVSTAQTLTLLASVTSNATAPFTGIVTFSSGSVELGKVAPDVTGTAGLTPSLQPGTYHIIATYSGDGFNAAAVSNAITVTVTQAADYSITLNPGSLSMATNQNSTVSMTLSSIGGFTDTLGLGCASLPAKITCTFSKPKVTLAANGQATVQLTVDTNSPLTAGGVARNEVPGASLGLASLFPASALLGWVLMRKRRKYARYFLWMLAAALTGSTLMLSGCNAITNSGAAPGSYVIQVTSTAASTGVLHAVDLPIKVSQ